MNKKFRTAPTLRAALVLTATSSLSACLDLDSFVMNPRHCSVGYSDDDCALKKMCTPCDEAYPFADFGLPAASARRQPILLADGETNDAWFFPSSGGALADTTIVFSHGNFGSLEHYLNRAGLLWATGANVFAVDYRGLCPMCSPKMASTPASRSRCTATQQARCRRSRWPFTPIPVAAPGSAR